MEEGGLILLPLLRPESRGSSHNYFIALHLFLFFSFPSLDAFTLSRRWLRCVGEKEKERTADATSRRNRLSQLATLFACTHASLNQGSPPLVC